MLQQLTRKLCPLMTLAIATVGCGKKISDTKSTPGQSTENQEPSSTMVIELDGTTGKSFENFKMPRNGSFELPTRLKVTGNALNKSVDITYDLDLEYTDEYEFKCSYQGISASEMRVTSCKDSYGGGEWSVPVGQSFPLRKNKIIQLRFTGASAHDIKVEAIYTVDWR